jgi:hypothetical protein
MIKAQTINGPKEQIAKELNKLGFEVIEAIVFFDDGEKGAASAGENIFAEMEPETVNVPDVDYSREAIYRRPDDE